MSPSNGHFVADDAVCCVNGGPMLLSMAPAATYNFLTSLEMLPKNNEFTWIVWVVMVEGHCVNGGPIILLSLFVAAAVTYNFFNKPWDVT